MSETTCKHNLLPFACEHCHDDTARYLCRVDCQGEKLFNRACARHLTFTLEEARRFIQEAAPGITDSSKDKIIERVLRRGW